VKFNGTMIKCLGLNNWGFDVVSVLVIEMLGKVPKECVCGLREI